MVEYRLAKARVAGSNPVSRFFYLTSPAKADAAQSPAIRFYKPEDEHDGCYMVQVPYAAIFV